MHVRCSRRSIHPAEQLLPFASNGWVSSAQQARENHSERGAPQPLAGRGQVGWTGRRLGAKESPSCRHGNECDIRRDKLRGELPLMYSYDFVVLGRQE